MPYAPAVVERTMKVQQVLMQAISGQITWLQAEDILGWRPRTLRRWRLRYQKYGYDGLWDRRRQLPSPRRACVEDVARIARLYRERYVGFNAAHFHEIARRDHGVTQGYTKKLEVIGVGWTAKAAGKNLQLTVGYCDPVNMPPWKNVPVKQHIQSAFNLPTAFQNDANAAAYGEYWVGKGRGTRSLVLFTLGTGIGGGIILDGRILEGAHSHDGDPGSVNAWVRVYEEDALASAERADDRLAAGDAPRLCGIPIGLKDLYAVAGKPVTASSRPMLHPPLVFPVSFAAPRIVVDAGLSTKSPSGSTCGARPSASVALALLTIRELTAP